MPQELIITEWGEIHQDGMLNVYREIQEKRHRFHLSDSDKDPICDAVRTIAPVFHVSLQAMQYRLTALKLLDFKRPEQGLFG